MERYAEPGLSSISDAAGGGVAEHSRKEKRTNKNQSYTNHCWVVGWLLSATIAAAASSTFARCGDYSPPRSNIFLCCLIFSCFSSCVIIGIDSLAKQFVVFSLRPPRCVCFNRLSNR